MGLRRHHDWLVVIALVLPEPEEPDAELPELVEPEPEEPEPVEPELVELELAVPEELVLVVAPWVL